MKVKKTEEDIANYRLEKINKIKKGSSEKRFHKTFRRKEHKFIKYRRRLNEFKNF